MALRWRRKPKPSPTGNMTVLEHLGELRRRVFISAIAVVVGATICFFFTPQIISFLVRYYTEATNGARKSLIFLGPADAFITRLKIATYGGIVLAMPVWLWQAWRFITPGLEPREKRYAVPFLLSAIVLFAFGAVVAFFTLEPALSFLLGVGGSDLQPALTADKYLTLVALMIVAFGISFEFPVVLVFLLISRVLTTRQLRSWRRYAIVLIFAFAAVITPSQDPYSLFFMAIPMILFYEGSILIGRILKR